MEDFIESALDFFKYAFEMDVYTEVEKYLNENWEEILEEIVRY